MDTWRKPPRSCTRRAPRAPAAKAGLTVGIDTFKLTRKFPRREHTPVSHDEEMFI
jgi:hypothetical protein